MLFWKIVQVVLSLLALHASHCATGHPDVNPLVRLRHDRARVELDGKTLINVSGTLNASGEWADVKWSNVWCPAKTDWVGMFVMANGTDVINPKLQAPVKYQYANYSDGFLKTGSGHLKFYVVNMRGPVKFAFFRGGFNNPVLSAVSNTLTFKNPNEPLQGHLSLTHNQSQMILMWTTRDSNKPQVKWGTTSGGYTWVKNATSTTYKASDMCDSPAKDYGWMDPGALHRVTMDNLVPGVRYYYVFGDEACMWSKEYSFKAAPVTGRNITTRVVALGDMGHGEYDDTREVHKLEQPALNTTRLIGKELNHTDFVLHVGDISYADGFAPQWDIFFDQIKEISPRVPYMVCPGNHESDSKNSNAFYQGHDSGGECNVPYINRFAMPRVSPLQPWYGFDYGCIHFVMMSTEHDFRQTSAQFTFLKEHMEKINKTKTPWIIFSGHRPMYIDSTNETEPSGELPVARLLRASLEALMMKYQVDVALWGHHHSYQRTCPVYNGTCTTSGGVTHVVIGNAGRSLASNVKPVKPDWLLFLDYQHYGYNRIAANSTTLVFEYVRNNDAQVHDRFILRKQT